MDQETKLKFFEDTIKEFATDLGCSDVSVHLDNISKFGVNYLGEILKVKVNSTKNDAPNVSFFVVKAVPGDMVLRKKMKGDLMFHSEAVMYDEILPTFDELQAEHGVGTPLNHCSVVKIVNEEYREMMLMHDLTSPGLDFEQSRIGKVLDLEHARSVVENIGRMHALSFATKNYSPGFLEKKLLPLLEMLGNVQVKMIIKGAIKQAIGIVEDPIAKDKLLEMLPTVVEYVTDILDYKHAEPYAVLVHGDIWSNNILFKYEEDTVVESVLLDWQIIRYHTPVIDILFFLCTSVADDVRAENFQSLLDLYYSTLSAHLRELNCDPAELFPMSAFEEHLKKFTKFVLMDVLFMLPVFTGGLFDPAKVDYSDLDNIKGTPRVTDLYVRRVNACLRDLINHGLF